MKWIRGSPDAMAARVLAAYRAQLLVLVETERYPVAADMLCPEERRVLRRNERRAAVGSFK